MENPKIPAFGFILTRHVNSEISNRYWQECYRCIRILYPQVTVMIIDDNSSPAYLKILPETPLLTNVWFIQSDYMGRGELLAYYYFWKYRPFQKAIILHDSVFLQPSFQPFLKTHLEKINTVRFLWHFPHYFDEPDKEEKYLQALEQAGCEKNRLNDLIYFYRAMKNEWLGCFGVMSVISHTFLTHLVNKYRFFYWFTMVFSRNERYVIERVFAALCCIEDRKAMDSLFGDIYETPRCYRFFWDDYVNGEWKKDESVNRLPLLKVWSGR